MKQFDATGRIDAKDVYKRQKQCMDIQAQEGLWYQQSLDLGTYQGLPIITFTDTQRMPNHQPHSAYLEVIRHGLRQTYPDMIDEEIESYLSEAIQCDKR